MANLLHTKGTRTQIYKTLPSNSVGNDGDIILSQIQGKGVYLCSKVNGRWHVSNKMEELRKIEKTSIKDLKLDRIRVGNTTITKDEYDVSSGDFILDVAGDIELNVDGGQIRIKDDTTTHFVFDCDNTSFKIHDDANELDIFQIQIGAEGDTIISTVDADTTVGHLTFDVDGEIRLDSADTGVGDGIQFLKAGTKFGEFTAHHTYSEMRLYENEGASTSDYLSLQCNEHGASKIVTIDGGGATAHLTLKPDGNTIISIDDGNESGGAFHVTPTGATNRAFSMYGEVDNFTTFLMYEMGGASTSDYFKIDTIEHGASTIRTVDAAAAAAHLTLDPDGDLILSGCDVKMSAAKKLYFDGGTHTYIEEQSADLLNFRVGGTDLFAIGEDATTSAAQSSKLYTGCPIYLKDIGGASDTPNSGYGSLYVNSDELFYKNDSGTVNRLDTASKFFLNIGCYYATSAKKWLPLAQGEYDQTTYPIDYATDNANFVVPYDMKINTIYVNHNRALSTTAQPGNTDIQLYKGGAAYSANVTVDINGSGYDTTNTAVVYTFDFSGETNTFLAGQVMAISLDPTSTAYWFAITICGEYI